MNVVIIDWCHLYEDFLDTLDVSFDDLRTELTGGWLFGYIEALQRAGAHASFLCVSNRVTSPERVIHEPTGAPLIILPAPRCYRRIRQRLLNPYADTLERAVGDVHGIPKLAFSVVRHVVPYLATPLTPLITTLRREHCDAILCQEYEHARFDLCVLLGRLMRLPVFATFQGLDWQMSRLERWVRPLSLRMCAGLIVGTSTEVQRVSARYHLPADKVAQVFNPIDLQHWFPGNRSESRTALGIPQTCKVVAWHGRTQIELKGLDTLLEAWARLCRDRPKWDLRLLLVGRGQDADELRRRIEAMRLRGVIWIDRYVKRRETLRSYLAAADVYAFPSRHDGFPVAPLEAMACGLPVVATDAPGVADILTDGAQSGGIMVPRDDAAAFARAVSRLLEDRRARETLGASARRRVTEHFSVEVVGRKLRTFLASRLPAARSHGVGPPPSA